MSRTMWTATAVLTLLSGAIAQNGIAQTMKHTMMHGAMKHDMAAMPPLDSMIKRVEVLVWRTEGMMRPTADTTTNAMTPDHHAFESPQAMAGSLHDMAIGLRGALRHMDAMHRAGMNMEGDPGAAMMDVHRRLNTVLGELEQMLQPTDRMHAHHMTMRP
ncbi:MAG: hypothetical protein ACYC3F_07610 [Gemmatimonadaceae bacterium]